MTDAIRIERIDGILSLTFNRPEKKNAVTADMYAALAAALTDAEDDGVTRAVLFRGAAQQFSAGNDLGDFLDNPPADENAPVFDFLSALANASLPYVAAVDGVAVGIGTTLLLHCDFVLITERARLQMPFVNLGIVPEAASTMLLPLLVGHARAAELLLLGAPIDGARAVALGLANRVVPAEQLDDEAIAIARALASKAPGALRAAKALMRAAPKPIGEVMKEEAAILSRLLRSPESREAFAAFLEKRPPRFEQDRR